MGRMIYLPVLCPMVKNIILRVMDIFSFLRPFGIYISDTEMVPGQTLRFDRDGLGVKHVQKDYTHFLSVGQEFVLTSVFSENSVVWSEAGLAPAAWSLCRGFAYVCWRPSCQVTILISQ